MKSCNEGLNSEFMSNQINRSAMITDWGGRASIWPTYQDEYSFCVWDWLFRTFSPTTSPSDCPHQFNYFDKMIALMLCIMQELQRQVRGKNRELLLSLWMSRCMSQLLSFSSVALSTPDFAKMLSRLPPNWQDTKWRDGVSSNEKASLVLDWSWWKALSLPLCVVICLTLRAPVGLSSINRAVSRPEIEGIFYPLFSLVFMSVVVFGYVAWISGSAPAL